LHQGTESEGEDLSGWTMVHKEGSKDTGGGYTSSEGTGKKPVYDPRASSTGKEGGRGDKGTGSVGTPAVNRSRPAMPQTRNLSDCPFPPQADMAQVDRAVVDVTVTVDPTGRPTSASVVSDPGYGFGPQARRCALGMRYEPALGPSGDPIIGTTPTLRFRFNR
jgi:protein TonB